MFLVPISGGVDSTVALYWAYKRYDIRALVFDYGLPANSREVYFSKKICDQIGVQAEVLSLSNLDRDMPRQAPPIGSLVMHSLSTYYSLAKQADGHIYPIHQWDSATHPKDPAHEQYSRKYLDKFEDLTSTVMSMSYSILSPFLDMGKEHIILLGKKLGVDFSSTWSCSSPMDDLHCGTCSACVERKVAFSNVELNDPTVYADNSQYSMGDLFLRKMSHYDPEKGKVVVPRFS